LGRGANSMMAPYVGKRVEVTGTVGANNARRASSASAPAMSNLSVTSVRTIDGTCQ
jgi:hypothetical protein